MRAKGASWDVTSQQCVHIHIQIMYYHTGNVSCDVVPNVQALTFQHESFNLITHLSYNCTLFNTWKDSVKIQKTIHKCKQDSASEQPTKIYTGKYLVMMETTISNCHKSFYIPEIQKLEFYIPHLQILGISHCGDSFQAEFKRWKSFQGVLCRRDYAERVVLLVFPIKHNHNNMA